MLPVAPSARPSPILTVLSMTVFSSSAVWLSVPPGADVQGLRNVDRPTLADVYAVVPRRRLADVNLVGLCNGDNSECRNRGAEQQSGSGHSLAPLHTAVAAHANDGLDLLCADGGFTLARFEEGIAAAYLFVMVSSWRRVEHATSCGPETFRRDANGRAPALSASNHMPARGPVQKRVVIASTGGRGRSSSGSTGWPI